MNDTIRTWTEEDSSTYRTLARVAVPDREEQIATLLALLPFNRDATFTVVELGSGEGFLSESVLRCFPNSSVIALDGSVEMREVAARRLERFGGRFQSEPFDITDLTWVERLHGADCVLSSLCVHHLDRVGKQAMFAGVFQQITPGGALLIADLVEPGRIESRHFFADTWDRETRMRSERVLGSDEGFDIFRKQGWNLYRFPDPVDQPSGLFEQLLWLREAGFADVDGFWMKAGHAIYGGYKPGGAAASRLLPYEEALSVANSVTKVRAE